MAVEAKRGDRVSLNTIKRPFYFQDGEFGLHLCAGKQEDTVIPEQATDFQLAQINYDIRNESLVLGRAEKKADVPDRDGDLLKILELGRNKISEWMTTLRDDKKVRHETKVRNFEKVISFEKSGKNRKSVIDAAEAALSYIGGVSSVEEETDKQPVEITLTSGNSEEELAVK